MRKIASLTMLLALSLGALAEDVQLKFVRPSRVLGIFLGSQLQPSILPSGGEVRVARLEGSDKGLVPVGVTLTAQDSKGILRLEGPEADLKEVRRYIELFDIQPRKVNMSLELSCPVLNVSSSTTTSLLNNRTWNMKDGTTNVDLSIAPRVNDDNTVTVYIEVKRGDQIQKVVARVKPDQKLYLRLGKSIDFALPKSDSEARQWATLPREPEEKKDSNRGDIDDPDAVVSIQMKIDDKVVSELEKISREKTR
jgi:hypothetical protein